MDNKTAKTLLDYATNNQAYPKYGKDIDFMGNAPTEVKSALKRLTGKAPSNSPGSGRGRGENVMGSGPGGAAASNMNLSRLTDGLSKYDNITKEDLQGVRNSAAVQNQNRSIEQLQQVRDIYKKAFKAARKTPAQIKKLDPNA